MALTVAFVGGGSIGHLAPMVAVWRALKQDHPDAEVIFLCSDRRADTEYLDAERVPYVALPAIRRNVWWPLSMWRAYRTARATLKTHHPDVLLSKGGGVAVSACFAAKKMKIPMVVHESDAIAGKATKLLSGWAAAVCYGLSTNVTCDKGQGTTNEYICHMSHVPCHITGNPVRPGIADGSRERGLKLTGLSGTRPILLVLGGSQGALALNQAVVRHLDELLTHCDVAHITGPGKSGATPRAGYWCAPIAYAELPDILAIATISLSRAGAGTIAELAACAVPTILVPLRGVAQDHQQKNAEFLQEKDACLLLPQEQMDALFVQTVSQLLHDSVKAKKIGKQLHSLHTTSASGQIAKVMLSCVAGGRSAA